MWFDRLQCRLRKCDVGLSCGVCSCPYCCMWVRCMFCGWCEIEPSNVILWSLVNWIVNCTSFVKSETYLLSFTGWVKNLLISELMYVLMWYWINVESFNWYFVVGHPVAWLINMHACNVAIPLDWSADNIIMKSVCIIISVNVSGKVCSTEVKW